VTDRWTPAQLSGTIRWVLKLEYAGGTWYMTDEAMTIDDGTGGTIVLTDGLLETGDTVESIDLWATEAPRRSSSVAFDLGIDVAALIEEGHDLAGCIAELAQLADGDPWTARRPFVRGRLVEPQYGAQGEGVQASIEQDVLTDESTLSPMTMPAVAIFDALDATTYPLRSATDDGIVIPVVFGTPGEGTAPGTVAASVGSVIDSLGTPFAVYAVAAHAVTALSVTLVNRDDGSTVSLPIVQVTIETGEVVALVFDDRSVSLWTPTATPVVIWDDGGGLVAEGIGELTHAGDFVAWLLSLTEQEVDQGRVNLARSSLAAFQVSGYVDDAVVIADYIREAVLDILPVSMMVGPKGVYPLVWRWDATSIDAVAAWDLTTDLDIARESVVTYEDADKVANTVQLRYGWGPRVEDYTREMWAVGDPASRPRGLRFGGAASLALSYWSDPILARSTVRYGVKRDSLETAIVHDDLTASRVLAWRSRRWALPSRVVEYSAPQTYAWVEPGDYVTVTDPDLAWTERLCLVQSRAWAADGSVRYTLRVQEG
jgi:hypothetical protein